MFVSRRLRALSPLQQSEDLGAVYTFLKASLELDLVHDRLTIYFELLHERYSH